jgi:hypothetical protein
MDGRTLWTRLGESTPVGPILEEEFYTAVASPSTFGQHHWRGLGDIPPIPTVLPGPHGYHHPGVYSLKTRSALGSASALALIAPNGTHQFTNLGGESGWTLEAIVVTDIAGGADIRFGLSDDPLNPAAPNAIQVRSGPGANWLYEVRGAGTISKPAGAPIVGMQSVRVRIRSLSPGTALMSLSINGDAFTPEAALAGVSAAPLSPFFTVVSRDGQERKLHVDYFRFAPGTLRR